MAATEILFLLAGIIAVIYYWSKHNNDYWRRKNVPFMEPTPIIGNIKDIFTMRISFGLHLSEIYNDQRFADAPAVGIYIFNKPALILREPELIKSVLIKDFNKFSNRYSACDPHGDALGSNNLFFVRNPLWKEIRTKVSPVFTTGKIKLMYPLMLEVATELEGHLARCANTGTEFIAEVKEICALFTTDLIATIAFGVRVDSLHNPNVEFRKRGRKLFDFTLPRAKDFFVAFFLPQFVTTFGVKLFDKEFSKFLRDTINHVMFERERSGTLRNDLIDILVAFKKEAALEDNVKHFARDNDFLVAQAAVFFTAGFETSSSTMSFALYELAKKPDLQNRLRKEICDALLEGDGSIPYDKMNSLEYLDMVLDEVLRLYPVLPFLDREYMHKEGEPEYTLKPYNDYVMRNGMPMYIPVYGLQRDPKFWPNPDTFDPERFSSENRKSINPMSYMPFGTGPHNCIGSRIGLLQAKIGLVHIFKNHYVTLCEKTVKDMRFDPKAFLLQCAGGIYLKLVKDNLYDKKSAEITTM